MKIPVAGLSPEELTSNFSLHPKYRGGQLFKWIQNGVSDFSAMTNIPAELKETLALHGVLRSTKIDETFRDPDGTIKLRIKLSDGLAVESVLLHDPTERKTACISSQAGCGMGCAFCKTATMGFARNLEAHEIVEQLFHLAEGYGGISNIVFMGMGEPILNIENVRRAVSVLHHPAGKNVGLRRITISTCGIASGIRELARNGPYTRLACSIPSAVEEVRRRLMPVAESNPLPALKDALLEYREKSKQRITIEVVLLSDVNDSSEDARTLAMYVRELDADVNLIPWNPAPGICYGRPEPEQIRRFASTLEQLGIRVVQRFQKGKGINAACGQLACE